MSDPSMTPLYSLVTFGRNDDYNPDFLYRLQTMLNFNARALEKIGRLGDVEFVVVDWGSEVPFREALALEASAAAATSFLEVSPETVAQVSNGPNGMHTTRAVNTGVRRARGRFVGFQGADLLTTNASWRALLGALENPHEDFPALSRSVLQIPRRIVPWSFVARQPDPDQWERWLLTCSQVTPIPTRSFFPAAGGGMGVIILHRDLWRDTNALEETFAGWGQSDIDLVLRVTAHHPWIDAGTYGAVSYKMEHAPHGLRGRLFSGERKTIAVNPHWITTSLAARFADWGLPHLVLEAKKAHPRAEFGDDTPARQMRDHIGKPDDLTIDRKVKRHVRAALGRARKEMYAEAELEILHVLSWFGLHRFPMTYLEIGLRHHFYVHAVCKACPSVDIYVLESEEKNRDGVIQKAVEICLHLLWKWGHKGYFRASAGNVRTNFERLKHSFIGPFELETVALNLEEPEDVNLLLPALQSVVDGGLLAIYASRNDLLNTALQTHDVLLTEAHIMRGHSGRTAFLFVDRKGRIYPKGKIFRDARFRLLRIPMATRLGLRAMKLRRRIRKLFGGRKIFN